MTAPRVLQIRAAGINCDRELRHAWERAGAVVEEIHIRALMEQPGLLRDCQVFALPGGFTYGDDLGAGRILALEVERFLGGELRAFHGRGGTLFGVCNGFQVLVKAGILPGLDGLRASLTWNASHRFECRWTRLRVERDLPGLPAGSLVHAPAAHAEGRLVLDPGDGAGRLAEHGLVAFRYADAAGAACEDWPACPSGSTAGIAGLIDASGRILGLMPHPERNLSPAHLPDLGDGRWGKGGEGLRVFRALLAPYLD